MFTPHQHPGNHHHGNITRGRRREATQISQDERLARHLQAQFDQELDVSVNDSGSSSSRTPRNSSVPSPILTPLLPGYPSNHTDNQGHVGGSTSDSNLWSSRGVSNARPCRHSITACEILRDVIYSILRHIYYLTEVY